MSKYTTGELAKLCGVTVRTVQYYDSRNILIPSELSEGGRRLYAEADLRRMKIICFLRDLGLSINTIGDLLSEEHPFSRILDWDNVCLTPHMAWGSIEARNRCIIKVAENIAAFYRGECLNRVE